MVKRPSRKRSKKTRKKRVTSRKSPRRKSKSSRDSLAGKWVSRLRGLPWGKGLGVLALLFISYSVYLDFVVRGQFEHNRWSLPAHVYARPLEIYEGARLSAGNLERELNILNYRYEYLPREPGTFQRNGNDFVIYSRAFQFWDTKEPSRRLKVTFSGDVVTGLQDMDNGRDVTLLRFDPVLIGGIYPAHREDRLLVKLDDVPALLPKILVAVEDRKFYDHYGINPLAIARAFWANLRAGKSVQGGSTITQQLVKNYFLSNERTLWRKFNEVIMAVLLDLHYSKDDIMQAYINEVYLGQDVSRAIHGFGLASRFYFDKPLGELDLNQLATLVALIRGPSYYHPEKHPQRLKKRRDIILDVIFEQGVIDKATLNATKQLPLRVNKKRHSATTRHPAFMDLLRRQLREYYPDSMLSSEGLRIFTTLDPLLQRDVEKRVRTRLDGLDEWKKLNGSLQAAAVLTNVNSSEILALVSDRDPQYAGFNRVLDASRPIGSLMKPVVYLSALKNSHKFNWLSKIDDAAISLKDQQGNVWSPKNYDKQSHGQVPLITALTQSYNQATVRLGLEVGFAGINETYQQLGGQRQLPAYPSILLGAFEMTPLEVAQMYQTLAANGFRSPLRSIREVLDANGEPLRRYPIKVEQGIESDYIQLINSGLIQVVERGTARSIRSRMPEDIILAGKTGTTDDLRDSWFAGFGGSHLGVVWLGTDDNQSTGLSGSSGALQLWGDIFRDLPLTGVQLEPNEDVVVVSVNPETGLLASPDCEGSMYLAFVNGTQPTESSTCTQKRIENRVRDTVNWFKRLFK